jgi:membrane-anchored protein YejM (alkaline phosphatase superfamily)
MQISERLTTRWLKATAVLNILLAFIISTAYWQWMGFSGLSALEKGYVVTTQIGWLGFLPALAALLIWPVRFLSSRVALALSIVLFTALSLYYFADTQVFALYKFHINAIVIDLFLADGIINFPLETWMTIAGYILLLVMLQVGIHYLAVRYSSAGRAFGSLSLLFWFSCLLFSQGLHAWKDAGYETQVTRLTRYFPLYYPLTAKSFFYKHQLVDKGSAREKSHLNKVSAEDLAYPTSQVEYRPQTAPTNVLFILIDAWRYDDFNPRNTPNIHKFSGRAQVFDNHVSGGNSTQAGLFSLFYSLPSPYWESFRNSGVRPVMMDSMAKQQYQFKILSSAPLNHPPFDRTVFNGIENLRVTTPGQTQPERDERITQDMLTFLARRDETQPFFGFLFYDAVHGSEVPEGGDMPFQPSWDKPRYLKLTKDTDPELFHNLYRNSLYHTDKKIGRILDSLVEKGLDKNTLVVISSDHGEEFNDNGLGYWGHGSNYTRAQIHVPMILAGPGLDRGHINKLTSHFDIAPTVMGGYLGVTSPAESYSQGGNMFGEQLNNNVLVIGSYSDYALVTRKAIHQVSMSGSIEHYDTHMRRQPDSLSLSPDILRSVIGDLQRFYR